MSNKHETSLFSHTTSVEYPAAAGYAVVALRVVLGWVFFYSGITKVLDPSWTAAGYLKNAVAPSNPFFGLWPMMAGIPFIDLLVQWGLTLTGLGLILGALVRFNAFWAAFMMVMFWASSLPLEHGLVVDQHIVYILLLFGLSTAGAGRIIGLDASIETTDRVRNNPWLRYLLG